MDLLKAMTLRTSTRSFKSAQVPKATLELITRAACTAPVGLGKYDTLHLTFVQNKEVLNKISETTKALIGNTIDPIHGAPTLVIISAKLQPHFKNIEYANASCVADHMMLAATSQEIGSCYLWGAPKAVSRNEELMKILEIPLDFIPVVAVALGHSEKINTKEKEMKMTIGFNKII